MFEEKSNEFRRNIVTLDMVCTVVSFLAAYAIWQFLSPESLSHFPSHLALLPFIIAVLSYFLTTFDAYSSPRLTGLFDYSWAILKSIVLGLGVVLALLFFLKIQYISRAVILIFALLDLWALGMARYFVVWYFRRSLRRGRNQLRVLIVGTGSRAQRFTEVFKDNTEWGIHVVGFLDPDPERVGQPLFESSVIGTVADIGKVLKENVIDEVIVAIPRSMLPRVDNIASACQEEGVRFGVMVDMFEMSVPRMKFTLLEGLPLLTMEPVAQDEGKLAIKRLMDLTVTLLAMPVLLPVLAVIAIAIRLDSAGPAFFVQQRVGLSKRRFPMFKFRTMVQNAEAMIKQIEHLNEAEGPIFKIAKDPRVTKVGRFLRRTSLDELPQLINVLRGEMSLVGPRPMSERDVDLFDQGIQRKRFSVKPGVTCLWQVSGRSNLPFSKWLELDLRYIDQWSLGLDVKILLKTIPVVLKGTGAV
jgi:exopolysaccharide biosynthesis polyprenyl glycosylphosphotransferase